MSRDLPNRSATLSSIIGSVAASGLTSVAGMVTGVLLARSLGPTGRGQFAAIVSWSGLLLMASELGLGFGVSYFAGKEPERGDEVFTQGLAIACALRALAFAVGAVVLPHIRAFESLDAPVVWLGLSPLLFGSVTGMVTAFFLGTGRIRVVNALGLAGAWVYAAGVLAIWLAGVRSVPAFVALFAGAQVATTVVAAWAGWRIGGLRPRWSRRGLRQLVWYGAKTQTASLAAQTNLRLDQVLMSVLVAPADLGLYAVAVAVSSMTGPLYSGLNTVLAPQVIRAGDARTGALRGGRILILAVVAGTVGAFALGVVAPWLLPALFGKRFISAVPLARVLLGATVFQGTNLLLGTLLRGLGRPGAPAIAEGIGAGVTVGLLALLLPRFGAMGAAVASLVAYGVVAVAEGAMSLVAAKVGVAELAADASRIMAGSTHSRSRKP